MPITLHLRPGAREWYAAWLARAHPELAPRYREIYRAGSYAPQAYQREVSARVRAAARRHGLDRKEITEHRSLPFPHDARADAKAAEPAAPAQQLTLL